MATAAVTEAGNGVVDHFVIPLHPRSVPASTRHAGDGDSLGYRRRHDDVTAASLSCAANAGVRPLAQAFSRFALPGARRHALACQGKRTPSRAPRCQRTPRGETISSPQKNSAVTDGSETAHVGRPPSSHKKNAIVWQHGKQSARYTSDTHSRGLGDTLAGDHAVTKRLATGRCGTSASLLISGITLASWRAMTFAL